MRIIVARKGGAILKWEHETRPGGSYSAKVEARGAFLVVTDVWGKETWIPADDVVTVETSER